MKKGIKLQPNWDQDLPIHWLDNSPVKTHFFNSFQMDFPGGETHVVRSVRRFKQAISDPVLLEDIDELCRQEAWHTKVHNDYNDWLASKGYYIPPSNMENRHSDLGNLAGTVVAEHLTATMADWLNCNSEFFDQMHPHFKEIYQWHMAEESDHRGVSYDVWTAVTDKIIDRHPAFKKTFKRVLRRALFKSTALILFYSLENTIAMLKKDGELYKWRTVKDFASLLFSPRTGIIPFLIKPHINFFKDDYHPWKYALTKPREV